MTNLIKEGIIDGSIQVIQNGDVMQDAAIYYAARSELRSNVILINQLEKKNFILCTIHRQENTDDLIRLNSIINALNVISKEMNVLVPLHPRTKKIIEQQKTFNLNQSCLCWNPTLQCHLDGRQPIKR